MKRSHLVLAVLSILLSGSLLLGLSGDLSAQPFGGHRGGGPGRGFFSTLTDEQREDVWELIAEMRDQGASREEIHEAVSELLAEWGIELPERPGKPNGPHGPRGPGGNGEKFWEELTEEQRAAIRSYILELWQDGATQQEIRDEVKEMLQETRLSAVIPGVNIPEQLEENVKGSYEKHKPKTPEDEQALKEFTRNYYANLTPQYRWLHQWERV